MVRRKILSSLEPRRFRLPTGQKEVWLPNWHITLVRTPKLPANMAEFLVPLNINKLDLKDYLFHAYGIPALSIRSSIQQAKVDRKWQRGPYYRPQSTKRMVVEMDTSYRGGPFVWPEEQTDFEAWDKELYDSAEAEREKRWEESARYGTDRERKAPGALKEQAQALLEGKKRWKPSWEIRNDLSSQPLGVGTPHSMSEEGP